MKILHLLAQLPHKTGSGIYYRNVIHRFQGFACEQAALFALQGDESFELLEPGRQYPVPFGAGDLPFPVAGMSDVMPYESTVYSAMDQSMLAAWADAFRAALERAKRDFAPDVILSHHLWLLTALATQVFPEAPIVGVCHNTDLRQAEQHPTLGARCRPGVGRLAAVLALSADQVPRITGLYGVAPERIITVGAGYDETLFFPPANKNLNNPVRIAFAGKIDRSKGVFELVQAFRRVLLERSGVTLDIVGAPNQDNRQRLEALTAGCDAIRLLPPMPQPALAEYLRRQDIFVLPSFYEGIGLIALESLACGLRVVASEIPGLMSLLGDPVNRSGAVSYVALPRMERVDQPVEADVDWFIQRLTTALLEQIQRAERGEPIPPVVHTEIQRHSWQHIAAHIYQILRAAQQ